MNSKHILEEPVASTVISHRFSHAVWGAIFAGSFVIVVSQMVLAFLGASIGLSTLNIVQGNNIKALGVGAAIWWIISTCIACYAGGMVAGRLSGIPRQLDGILHALVAFSMTVLFSFLFLSSSLGAIIAGGMGVFKAGMQSAAAVAPQIAGGVSSMLPQGMVNSSDEATRNEINQVFSQLQNPAQRQELADALAAMASTNNVQAQKQQAVNILTQNGIMSQPLATDTVNRWSQNIQNIKQDLQGVAQTAAQSAQGASRAAAGLAFASFIMLVLGGIFAGWGGSAGAPHWADQEIA
ncbi:MAG: hypothetical protein KGK03_05610 [Candidatus Omnitrophica bacterium]|nr:hypothetical protein [Candidatus Omnitrophota bacterium]MDE2222531.1 hypothetical protein [Candidatus Omnitrophota bacterium]